MGVRGPRPGALYVDQLEFTPTSDGLMGAQAAAGDGARWLRLTPPGGGADVTLVTWFADVTPPRGGDAGDGLR